jgi:phage shock protein A
MLLLRQLEEIVQIDVNDLMQQADDPGKALDQAIDDMQKVLKQAKAVVSSIDSVDNKKAKFNYSAALVEVHKWRENLQKALNANNERLSSYALERLKNHEASARIAKSKLDKYTEHEDILRQNLAILQKKVKEVKAEKYWLESSALTEQLIPQVIKASNPTLESELREMEYELESTKTRLLEQQVTTGQLLIQNSATLKRVRSLLRELEFNKDVDG